MGEDGEDLLIFWMRREVQDQKLELSDAGIWSMGPEHFALSGLISF